MTPVYVPALSWAQIVAIVDTEMATRSVGLVVQPHSLSFLDSDAPVLQESQEQRRSGWDRGCTG